MSDYVLLTDSDDPSITAAVGQLESWSVQRVTVSQLAAPIEDASVRAVLVVTTDPTELRAATERAHASSIPVIIGYVDDTARRRAVQHPVREWYRTPAYA